MTNKLTKAHRKYCCKRFKREATSRKHNYTELLYPTASNVVLDKQDNGTYSVTGCCGNCYVLSGIKYCPFCGSKL